jgi:hypothetical protein
MDSNFVECGNCYAHGSSQPTKQLSISAWNRRVAPENVSELERLKAKDAALKAQYDEINRYNISCTKEIDRLLVGKLTIRGVSENDNAEVYLEAYKGLLQKAEDLNETLLKKLKTSSPENKPLSLGELRNIDKEKVPVWIAEKGSPNHGEYWQYAYDFNSDMMAFFTFGNECEEFYSAKDYGKTWLAYARRPEGSEKA